MSGWKVLVKEIHRLGGVAKASQLVGLGGNTLDNQYARALKRAENVGMITAVVERRGYHGNPRINTLTPMGVAFAEGRLKIPSAATIPFIQALWKIHQLEELVQELTKGDPK